jgi:hypothetical protein
MFIFKSVLTLVIFSVSIVILCTVIEKNILEIIKATSYTKRQRFKLI